MIAGNGARRGGDRHGRLARRNAQLVSGVYEAGDDLAEVDTVLPQLSDALLQVAASPRAAGLRCARRKARFGVGAEPVQSFRLIRSRHTRDSLLVRVNSFLLIASGVRAQAEQVSAVLAAPVDERRLAALTDDGEAATSALRAVTDGVVLLRRRHGDAPCISGTRSACVECDGRRARLRSAGDTRRRWTIRNGPGHRCVEQSAPLRHPSSIR